MTATQAPPRRPKLLVSLGTYTLLGFVPMATNLVVVPIYLRYLTVAQYGLVGLANLANSFVLLALGLGLVEAYERQYFEEERSAERTGQLLGTVLGTLVVSLVVLSLILLFAGSPLFAAALPSLAFDRFGWWVLLFAFGSLLQSVIFLSYRNAENLRMAMVSSLVPFACGTAGIVIGIAPLGLGATGAVAGRSVGYLLGIVPGLVILLRRTRLTYDRRVLEALFAYGLPVLAYVLLNNVLFLGDRLLFERWASLETLGIYILGLTILSPAEILANAVTPAVQPRIYRKLTARDPSVWPELRRIYEVLFAVQVVLLSVAVTCSEPVVRWLGRDAYGGSAQFLPILAVGQLFRVRYFYFSLPLFYFKRTRFLPLMTAGSIAIGFATAWLSFHLVGPVGIAAGVVAWKFSQQAVAHLYVRAEKLSPDMGLPSSTVLTIAFLGYFVADVLSGHATIVRWGGAGAMCLAAAIVLLSTLKTKT